MPRLNLVPKIEEQAQERGRRIRSVGKLLASVRRAKPHSPRRFRLTFNPDCHPKRAHYLWDLHDRGVIILDVQSIQDLSMATSRHDWVLHPGRSFSFTVKQPFAPATTMSFAGRFGGVNPKNQKGDIDRIERLQASPP